MRRTIIFTPSVMTVLSSIDRDEWKVLEIGLVPQPPLNFDKLMEGVTDDNKHNEEKL